MAIGNVLNTGAPIVLGGTLTTNGAVTFSGGFTFTGTLTGNTSVTFPTSGTLATTSGGASIPPVATNDILYASNTNVLSASQTLPAPVQGNITTIGANSGAAITIGNTSGATSIVELVGTGNYVLNGAAASTYAIGAATVSGSITIGGGSQNGDLTIGVSGGTNQVLIGNGTGITTVNIAANVGNPKTVNIATGVVSNTITIGNFTGTTSISEKVAASYTLDGVAGTIYSIGASTTTGSISVGGSGQTGSLTLGSSSGVNAVNLGTGEGATTVNIATGATSAKTVNIATGAVANTINLGSSTGGSVNVNSQALAANGSNTSPAYSFASDTNTGMYRVGADSLGFSVGGAVKLTLDSPGSNLLSAFPIYGPAGSNTIPAYTFSQDPDTGMYNSSGNVIMFATNGADRLGIGTVNINAQGTSQFVGITGSASNPSFSFSGDTTTGIFSSGSGLVSINTGGTSLIDMGAGSPLAIISGTGLTNTINIRFKNSAGTNAGSISTAVGGTNTAYTTASDYRLKKDVVNMQDGLDTILKLRPVKFKWHNDSEGSGFIAHELQKYFPEAVCGKENGLDEDGQPEYQGVDTSFLVGTLVAAIQDLKKELDEVKKQLMDKV